LPLAQGRDGGSPADTAVDERLNGRGPGGDVPMGLPHQLQQALALLPQLAARPSLTSPRPPAGRGPPSIDVTARCVNWYGICTVIGINFNKAKEENAAFQDWRTAGEREASQLDAHRTTRRSGRRSGQTE